MGEPGMPLSELFGKRKADLILGLFILYVALLVLGTVGELFDISWILSLPIFRPPR
jgi:hypothetical protein